MIVFGLFRHRPHARHSLLVVVLVLVSGLALGACRPAAGENQGQTIPASDGPAAFEITEFPLVEQSSDNPTHPEFIQHVPEHGLARRLAQPAAAMEGPNHDLAAFGYRLALSVAAPYHIYTLYQGEQIVQEDILTFWPVTLNAAGSDFLLPFETLDGDRKVASRGAISDWPGGGLQKTSPPVFIGDRLAYAAVSDSQVSVQAGGQVLYLRPDTLIRGALTGTPGRLSTWDGHWALELDGRVILDGQDLNTSLQAEHIFLWHMIDGQPFCLFSKDGLAHASYAGQNLPYTYDAIVAGNTPESALFRPASGNNVVWFFALRDGLWYYVEAGRLAE